MDTNVKNMITHIMIALTKNHRNDNSRFDIQQYVNDATVPMLKNTIIISWYSDSAAAIVSQMESVMVTFIGSYDRRTCDKMINKSIENIDD